MSANARFLLRNLADAAVVTASSEVSTLPATNVQTPQRTTVWRSTGVGSQWIKFDLGAAKKVSVIAFTGINADWATAGGFNLRANTTDSWGSVVWESGFQPWFEVSFGTDGAPWLDYFGPDLFSRQVPRIYFLPSPQTLRWWSIDIAGTLNSAGYDQIGRIYLGDYFEPAHGYLRRWQEVIIDPSRVARSLGGQDLVDVRDHRRQVNLAFNSLTSDDVRDHLMLLLRQARAKESWLCLDPTTAEGRLRHTYYGRLAGPSHNLVARGLSGTRRATQLAFTESL